MTFFERQKCDGLCTPKKVTLSHNSAQHLKICPYLFFNLCPPFGIHYTFFAFFTHVLRKTIYKNVKNKRKHLCTCQIPMASSLVLCATSSSSLNSNSSWNLHSHLLHFCRSLSPGVTWARSPRKQVVPPSYEPRFCSIREFFQQPALRLFADSTKFRSLFFAISRHQDWGMLSLLHCTS